VGGKAGITSGQAKSVSVLIRRWGHAHLPCRWAWSFKGFSPFNSLWSLWELKLLEWASV